MIIQINYNLSIHRRGLCVLIVDKIVMCLYDRFVVLCRLATHTASVASRALLTALHAAVVKRNSKRIMEAQAGGDITAPFPIFLVAGRYMLYDVNVVSYIRRVYHMCGCLIGTLPQIPQQNVFLGLPLELMVEEASLLVEKGAAYIVDDLSAHRAGLKSMLDEDKKQYLIQRDSELKTLAEEHQKAALMRKAAVLKKKGLSDLLTSTSCSGTSTPTRNRQPEPHARNEYQDTEKSSEDANEDNPALFASAPVNPKLIDLNPTVTFHETKTTSSKPYQQLPAPTTPAELIPKPSPTRYAIYRHLHSHDYYLSPGIRFGAQFMAYPGDPLRFHSHFVVNGLGWDEEINVMDIVGGGRLGTGVKKGWMVGGVDPANDGGDDGGGVRVFSVEWGGF
ncbi:hypothetical protein BDZ91DRAFT_776868 [Kalaharituber pfeilii]|nr:hypothetical protein BDZ91DRAFT_776868 [Kalaharituber pfeilii]